VGLVAALALVLVMTVAALHRLERPWLKQRIVSRVEAATGLQLDYQTARVAVLSGLRLEGLVVRTPSPFRSIAPELLRVGMLEAEWSPRSLLSGTTRVERVVVRDMAIALVADDAGPTSLMGLMGPEAPEPPPVEAPLGASQRVAALLASAPPFRKIELSGMSLSYVRVRNGEVLDRWTLRGLAAAVEAKHQEEGWKIFAEMGQPGTPLPLELNREGATIPPALAQLELTFSAEVGASAARARVDLDVARQTFDPQFTVRTLLHGAVSAKFDGEKRHIDLELDRAQLTDSAEVRGRWVLPDAADVPPVVTRALADVDLGRLLRQVPADLRPFSLEHGKVHLDAQAVTLSAMPQLGAQGRLGLDFDVAALQLVQDDLRVALGGGQVSFVATPDPQKGVAAQLAFALQGLELGGPTTLRVPKASGELKGHQLRPDLSSPLKVSDEVAYTLAVQTPDLVAARPFISESVAARVPWKHLAVKLASTGRLAALFSSSPRVEHRTELRLQRPAWDDVSASTLAVVMRSHGDSWRHKGDLDLRIEGLRIGENDAGPQHQTLTLDLDRRKPSLRLGLTSPAGLKLALEAAVAFDRKARALRLDVEGDVPPLGALSPLLTRAGAPKELEPSRLALKVGLHGTLLGALTDIAADGTPSLVPSPLRTATFEGTAVVDARGIRWREDARSINLPALHWEVESHADGPRRIVHSHLAVEKLNVGMPDRRLSFVDASSDTTATFTEKWEAGEIELKQLLKVRALEQNPALSYPVQDLEWSFSARREPTGVIHIPDLQLTNAGTSTQLKAKGRLELGDDRRRLAVRGELEQDLSRLRRPGQVESSGRIAVDFQVASPNLVVFRTLSNVLFQNVNLRLPESGITIETLDGNVPLTENVEYTEGEVRLLSDLDVNPYSMLRFADQHPLLSRNGFVSAASITTPRISIAPLAGNLSIDQNVFSMRQLEMGVRGGRVTGQCVLNWEGKHSSLEAHVRATGVKSSRGEPFDGNAAVVISGKDRSVNGRAEILRIGNRHLLDLLDLQDPHHTDPATNRIRYRLGFGYPEQVRLSFNHGFGRLNITMGGLARLFSIDELRGIPMGPIVDRAFDSLSAAETTP